MCGDIRQILEWATPLASIRQRHYGAASNRELLLATAPDYAFEHPEDLLRELALKH